jgi:hypothetical protein
MERIQEETSSPLKRQKIDNVKVKVNFIFDKIIVFKKYHLFVDLYFIFYRVIIVI